MPEGHERPPDTHSWDRTPARDALEALKNQEDTEPHPLGARFNDNVLDETAPAEGWVRKTEGNRTLESMSPKKQVTFLRSMIDTLRAARKEQPDLNRRMADENFDHTELEENHGLAATSRALGADVDDLNDIRFFERSLEVTQIDRGKETILYVTAVGDRDHPEVPKEVTVFSVGGPQKFVDQFREELLDDKWLEVREPKDPNVQHEYIDGTV